jgi:hypothetical protein
LYIIAGVDPGKTCGIACLDLNGNLVFNDHMMHGGFDWLVSTIGRIGTPVIVAGDKPGASEMVKRINSAFNSRLFCPEREFRITEKRNAVKKLKIKDPHERDAYAAAIAAYHAYENKFKQIERKAHQNNFPDIDNIKAKVVGRHSINEAVENKKANRKLGS